MKLVSASMLLLGAAITAGAQASPVAPGWAAFAGCWAPIPVEGQVVLGSTSVCVVPTGVNGAELISLSAGAVTERVRIEADGRRNSVSRQGCSGWESASFSADGRRLYLDSDQDCAAGLKRRSAGLFALAPDGQWVNISHVAADSGQGLRVMRFTPTSTTGLPAAIAAALDSSAMAYRTARVAAQARVSPDAVIEASKQVPAPVVESWLAEIEQPFNLDAKTLIRLDESGVAPSVIDVMVAVSNPKHFAVKGTGSGVIATSTAETPVLERRNTDCVAPLLDPWGYYDYDPCDPYRRYRVFGSYRYGYPYYRYGMYDPYGRYGSSYFGYDAPVTIIVRGSPNDPDRGGRMTAEGYKSGTTTPSGTASTSRTRETTSSSSSGGSSASGSSSSGSSSGGSASSGGSSSGRTATRKPPAN